MQEKYKIAKDTPGSGNTKNIGSCTKISDIKEGKGPFTRFGVKVFDDYWCNYHTGDMAMKAGFSKAPYTNLVKFLEYRKN